MTTYSPAALRIHADLPVVDGHNDLPWKLRTEADGDLEAADPRFPLPHFHTDIPRMLAGGVGAQFWSVYVPADVPNAFEQSGWSQETTAWRGPARGPMRGRSATPGESPV